MIICCMCVLVQVCRNINQIKICMETGRTVILLNLENLYESLYDVFNQVGSNYLYISRKLVTLILLSPSSPPSKFSTTSTLVQAGTLILGYRPTKSSVEYTTISSKQTNLDCLVTIIWALFFGSKLHIGWYLLLRRQQCMRSFPHHSSTVWRSTLSWLPQCLQSGS